MPALPFEETSVRVFEKAELITTPPKGYIGGENYIIIKEKISKQEQWQLDYENAYKELDDWYPQIEVEPITLKEQIQQITKKSKIKTYTEKPNITPSGQYPNSFKKNEECLNLITLEDYLSELNIPTLDEEYISALNVPKLKTKIIID
jgi:hypothetical protein